MRIIAHMSSRAGPRSWPLMSPMLLAVPWCGPGAYLVLRRHNLPGAGFGPREAQGFVTLPGQPMTTCGSSTGVLGARCSTGCCHGSPSGLRKGSGRRVYIFALIQTKNHYKCGRTQRNC